MLEEFDPMCDDIAYIKKQKLINEAIIQIKREEELMAREEARREEVNRMIREATPRTWVDDGPFRHGTERATTWTYIPTTYGYGGTTYTTAAATTYTTAAATTYTTAAATTFTITAAAPTIRVDGNTTTTYRYY